MNPHEPQSGGAVMGGAVLGPCGIGGMRQGRRFPSTVGTALARSLQPIERTQASIGVPTSRQHYPAAASVSQLRKTMAGLAGKVALVTGAAKGEIAPPASLPWPSWLHCRRHCRRPCRRSMLYCCTRRVAAGIGLACAQSLGRAGAKVLVADIDAEGIQRAEQQLQEEGIDAASTVCDVSNKQQVSMR